MTSAMRTLAEAAVATRLRRAISAVAVTLFTAIWWFVAFGLGRILPSLGFLFSLAVLAPIPLMGFAAYLASSVFVKRRSARVLFGTFGYLAVGVLYSAIRSRGYFDDTSIEIAAWPVLLLWQDLCSFGLWPCPAG